MARLTRRTFFERAAALAAVGLLARPTASASESSLRTTERVPVIDITDLYHPPQDPGDNFDLIAAFALPTVDLKAVILDVTARFREKVAASAGDVYQDTSGPRDPGFIPVWQLEAIFGSSVPCAVGPFEAIRAPDDPMRDAPAFQQTGVELLLKVLRESTEKVHVLSFGSARPLAVAWNREPDLLRERIARVHLSAGAAPAGYLEWNVMLDRHAFVRVLQSDLPLALYPCATDKGPFDLGTHNSFWKLPNLEFIREMHPALRRYLAFAFTRTVRMDFLRALEHDPPAEQIDAMCRLPHNVWETAIWAEVAGLRLVRRGDGTHRLVPASEVAANDTLLPSGLRPCCLSVREDGQFTYDLVEGKSKQFIYERGDPAENERALREALPALYRSFVV